MLPPVKLLGLYAKTGKIMQHNFHCPIAIVGRGTCAYYVQMSDAVEVFSAYELDYPDDPAAAPQRSVGAKGARYEQLDLFAYFVCQKKYAERMRPCKEMLYIV